MTLLPLELFYVLAGMVFLSLAVRSARNPAHPRRWTTSAFWLLLSVAFVWGRVLPPVVVGYAVLALVALAALGGVRPAARAVVPEAERMRRAEHHGHRLFAPALLIPGMAVLGSLTFGAVQGAGWRLVEARHATLIGLGVGAVLAVVAAARLTRVSAAGAAIAGGPLIESIGPVLLLPQLLAALGGLLAHAGVGTVIADLVSQALPGGSPYVAVVAYCLGMALFTIGLGNAFAAFPVITLGIGLPLIVQRHGGNPAIMAAIGMLSGYCGTLLTPMAANFNLVPALLLELPDRHAVIKAQWPIALVVWLANVALMSFCVYRF